MLTEEQIAARRTGLGGSDIGTMLGLNPYQTPFELWQEKTGRAEPFAGNLATRFGSFAEQFVADEYTRVTGQRVQRFNAMLRHPDAPIVGHIDRLVIPEGAKRASHRSEIRTDRGLEAKTASAFAVGRDSEWGEPGTDAVPQTYLIQCVCYMALTGCQRWDLGALIGGNTDFRVYHLERDGELEGYILEEASRWWRDHVVADVPPDPMSEVEARQRWTKHRPGKTLELDSDTAALLHKYAALKREIKTLADQESELRDVFVPVLADADTIQFGDLTLATFRANKHSHRTDWQSLALELLSDYDESEREHRVNAHTEIKPGSRVLRLAKGIEQFTPAMEQTA